MTSVPNIVAGAYLPNGHMLQDRYRIAGEVGRGGYSVVYRAEDTSLGSDVAVKLLVPPPATAHIARERMKREVRAARSLAHPHIVAVHDFLEEGPWSFIVMELVDGEDLATHIGRCGVMNPYDAARIGSQIADALATAHQHGVLHRDVKPQNILMDNTGNARLVDFGSARLDGLTTMTQTGGIVGTIAYTAPEVLAGGRGDARSDLYALGMTMWFGLVGRVPVRSVTGQLDGAHEALHPKHERSEIPDWLDNTIARATAHHPARRFPTAANMQTALTDRDGYLVSDSKYAENTICLICDATDPFGLGLCVSCAGSGPDADTLVFLKPAGESTRAELWNPQSTILGRGRTDSEIEGALAGERALVRVPRAAAEGIVDTLAGRSIGSIAVHHRRVGQALPKRFFGLLAAVVGVGMLAGVAVDPRLLVASPTIALLLWLLAVRVAARPVITAPNRRSNLPPETEQRVIGALASLPAGSARDLLAELVRLVDRAYKRVTSASYNVEVANSLVDLMDSACDVASDIAECDQHLKAPQGQPFRAPLAADLLAELTRVEQQRDQLVQKFLEATAVVARVRNDAMAMDSGSSDSIQQATANLMHQLEATLEVERLLT